jgi:hypothetical protein
VQDICLSSLIDIIRTRPLAHNLNNPEKAVRNLDSFAGKL